MLETAPTKEDVLAYLDRYKDSGGLTIEEALMKSMCRGDVDNVWLSVRNDEKPIAEFCALWHDNGDRRSFKELRDYGPRRHVTPEAYK